MNHLLATRYRVDEDFGIKNNLERIDGLDADIKEKQSHVNRKDNKNENETELQNLRKELGSLKDQRTEAHRQARLDIGTELFNRYMKGFLKNSTNQEENERVAHTEFLFKKLKF